ncbi:hypothetical protein D3C72_829400 [compost metagenome]
MHATIIAVYDQQDKAVATVETLKESGFGKKHMTLLGKVDADDSLQSKMSTTAAASVGAGAIIGPVVGALAGIGIIAIPGLGFIYGAGALAGAIMGFDFGIIGGGIIANLLLDGEKSEIADMYEKELQEGKTLLIFRDSQEAGEKALEIIKQKGGYNDVTMH